MSVLNQLSIKSLYMLSTVANSKDLQQASENLCISPSALSHQMQRLEDKVGKKLFYKEGRNQKLLPEAQKWANTLSENFVNIEQSTKEFIGTSNNIIHLGVQSAFAFSRITPLLGVWLQTQPDMDVRVRMLNCEDDPAALNLDVVLSSPLQSRNYTSEYLTSEKYIPVCSPDLYKQLSASNLDRFYNELALLDLTNVDTWQRWQTHFSMPINPISVSYFSHTILLLQAVLSGQGVALLDYYLVKEDLEKGLLVQLQQEPMIIDGLAHHYSVLSNRKNEPSILLLKNWLQNFFI